MLDFTSAAYLGMCHPSEALEPWDQFTTGVPAALKTSPGAPVIAAALADLQGCEQATLGTSTLHLFWDLFGMLAADEVSIYVDDGVYPIARWGIERAAARGAKVKRFPHHDVGALRKLLSRNSHARHRPVIVSDGFCPSCARHAPIAGYLEIARNLGGQLVMDDTQAIGIFGHAASGAPYGRAGGGTLRRFGLSGPGVISISSLAKGFGVPVAVLTGERKMVESFERASETRMHCSPPSNAVLSALSHALAVNDRYGDALRLRLVRLVLRFRKMLDAMGLSADGGLFPVQTLAGLTGSRAAEIHKSLDERGVKTVLRRSRCTNGTLLTFIITARHNLEQIQRAADALEIAQGSTVPSRFSYLTTRRCTAHS